MRFIKVLTSVATAIFGLMVCTVSVADTAPKQHEPITTPRLHHTNVVEEHKLKFTKDGFGYYDVYIINYRYEPIVITARFQNGTVGTDVLNPYGYYPYQERIDMYYDDYVYITITTVDGRFIFSGPVAAGTTLKVWP